MKPIAYEVKAPETRCNEVHNRYGQQFHVRDSTCGRFEVAVANVKATYDSKPTFEDLRQLSVMVRGMEKTDKGLTIPPRRVNW